MFPGMSPLIVRPVAGKRDEMAFIKFPWSVYKGYPQWVPPLLMDRKKLIDRRKNPFYRHAEMELFLAERDGEIVGRIGAIINANHNREHKENIGFFGFFECYNDREVAQALLDRAVAWLRERGVDAVRGPASPSVNDEYGLLIEGFDKPPAILMTYNPPYYQELIEGYGFTKARDLYAYYVHSKKVFSERLVRISELLKKREGLVFRSLNMKDFANEVKTIRDLYNRGWEGNWGEVPMTEEEFDYVAGDLKAIVDPNLVIIAEVKGKPVGFGMSLPDLNMVLKDNTKGYLIPALVRLLLFRKRIDFIRIVILGVVPEYRNSGIGAVLFYETGRRAVEHGYPHGEASWVLEDNAMMNRGAEMLSGDRYKTYRVYDLPLNNPH
jgi:GNAT superfamily N-acetyltransferase